MTPTTLAVINFQRFSVRVGTETHDAGISLWTARELATKLARERGMVAEVRDPLEYSHGYHHPNGRITRNREG
jgi:hypothetical protein